MSEPLFTVRIINDAKRDAMQKVLSSKIVLDLDAKEIYVYWGTSTIRESFDMNDVTMRTGPGGAVDIIVFDAEYERRYGK